LNLTNLLTVLNRFFGFAGGISVSLAANTRISFEKTGFIEYSFWKEHRL